MFPIALPYSSPPLRFHAPRIPIGTSFCQIGLQLLHASVQLAGIDRGPDEEVLRLGQLSAQLGVLDRQGEDQGGRVVASTASTGLQGR